MRAMSTVVDVSLFLLLLSGAVVAFTIPPTIDDNPPDAETEAQMLATSTTAVTMTYSTGDETHHRGTYAALVADAAVANLTGPERRGESVTTQAIETAVANATRRPDAHVAVTAKWQPYPDAPLEGCFAVGSSPPPKTAARTATLTVPSGFPHAKQAAIDAAAQEGYSGVASVIADAIVQEYVAPDSQLGSRRDDPAAQANRRRARTLASALGVSIEAPLETGELATARHVLQETLETRLEANLRETFETPLAAARVVSVSRVKLTATVWSA